MGILLGNKKRGQFFFFTDLPLPCNANTIIIIIFLIFFFWGGREALRENNTSVISMIVAVCFVSLSQIHFKSGIVLLKHIVVIQSKLVHFPDGYCTYQCDAMQIYLYITGIQKMWKQ